MKTLKGYAIVAALVLPNLAYAVPEQEENAPAMSAQTLEIDAITVDNVATTGAIVDGSVGVNVPLTLAKSVLDFDYYDFKGHEGDVVTLDIDNGIGGVRDVDTVIAIFGPAPAYKLLSYSDDMPKDPGSTDTRDARIDKFRLPADGEYTVGVGAWQSLTRNVWISDATPTGNVIKTNGDYTLIIAGVSLEELVQQISIEIKPGSGEVAPIQPKSKGKVPVALLGSSEFLVDDVDAATLTFGHSGDEASQPKCGAPSDVNGDLFPDMVCHFENQAAKFAPTDTQAILRGELDGGKKFEGHGWLKVVPGKANQE